MPSADQPGAAAGRRVLVIEDHADAAEMMELALSSFGHEVRTAPDGTSGLAAAHEFRPDVVLCDIGLPGMSGFEVAAQLRGDDGASTPLLIALTGFGRQEDAERCRRAGFDLHLVKPVDIVELHQILVSR